MEEVPRKVFLFTGKTLMKSKIYPGSLNVFYERMLLK